MGLIGNYSVLAKDPGRSIGGGSIGLGMNRSDFNKLSQARGAFTCDDWDQLSGIPDGYRDPYCWVMPIKPGALAARKNIAGAGTFVGAVAGGVNGTATIAGVGTLSGIGDLIVSLAASIGGTGTISGAQLQAFLQLAAAIGGTGTVAGTTVLTALGNLATALGGSGTVAGTTVLTAIGTLEAEITVTGGTLTTANVASAVWSALATANNDAGTMGEKLNSASSAGDPWGTALPGAYGAGTAGDIVGNFLEDLLDGQDIEAGLTVRQALRLIGAALAGKISGASGTTVTIRNAVADTKDRIVATVDSDGNRTAITYDLTD